MIEVVKERQKRLGEKVVTEGWVKAHVGIGRNRCPRGQVKYLPASRCGKTPTTSLENWEERGMERREVKVWAWAWAWEGQ